MTSVPKKPQTRNCLSLEKKVEVIKYQQKNPTISIRALGEQFNCGKTQIAYILKNKAAILSLYQQNVSAGRHITGKSRASEFADVNEALYKWFCIACSKNIYPGGPELMEKAKEIADKLGKPNFKGSRGWLDKWKKRFNVKQLKISGESGDVEGATVDSWKERLPEIVHEYEKANIWNMDETGLFWQALPDKGFGQRSKQCKGGKKAKKRLTVAFFVNAAGNKEKPIVIWKSQNPRCFRGFDKSLLPVTYFSQPKAWMTGDIMEAILSKLNRQMISTNRKILLFMDNAGCHPQELCDRFSNIQICFLPANTTSILQPLDLGIIKNFKLHYRRNFLRYVISKIDECDKASDVVKSLNILIAIRWVALAWSQVTTDTISKCFRKAGILDKELDVICRDIDDQDPFLEADKLLELGTLIEKTSHGGCSTDEFVRGDDDLPVCVEMDGDDWQSAFLDELTSDLVQEENEEDSDCETEYDNAGQDVAPKIKTYKEAIVALEDVVQFLQHKGNTEEALSLGATIDGICMCRNASTIQTTLDSFLSRH